MDASIISKPHTLDNQTPYVGGSGSALGKPTYLIRTPPSSSSGTLPESAATEAANIGDDSSDSYRAKRRKLLYSLRRSSAKILGRDWGVHDCGRKKVQPEVVLTSKGGSAYYTGIHTCKSPWVCPVCHDRKMTENRERIAQYEAAAKHAGLTSVHAVFTIQHDINTKESVLYADLRDAFSSMLSGSTGKKLRERFGFVGYVKMLEPRWGGNNGPHPHYHVEFYLDLPDGVTVQDFGHAVAAAYCRRLDAKGYTTNQHTVQSEQVKSIGEYLTKGGIADELTRFDTKAERSKSYSQFELLLAHEETGKSESAFSRAFAAMAEASAGMRMMQTSRKLAEALDMAGYMASEEAKAEEVEAEAVEAVDLVEAVEEVPSWDLVLDSDSWNLPADIPSVWDQVRDKGLSADLLTAAEKGDKAFTVSWLTSKGITWPEVGHRRVAVPVGSGVDRRGAVGELALLSAEVERGKQSVDPYKRRAAHCIQAYLVGDSDDRRAFADGLRVLGCYYQVKVDWLRLRDAQKFDYANGN